MAFSSYTPEQIRARLLAIHLETLALLGVTVEFCQPPPSRWQRVRSFFGV